MEAEMVKSETALEMKRVFKASAEQLFQAWTKPEMMNNWYHSGPNMHSVCTVDLRVGGRYEVQMHPEEGDPYIVGGVYREIVPQEKLVFTWLWKHEDASMESLVTLKFKPLGKGETELVLIHERFSNEEERDNHAEGWIAVLDQLEIAFS